MEITEIYDNLDEVVLALLIALVTIYVCNVARKHLVPNILNAVGLDKHDYRMAAAEMIGTMESAVMCFELNFIIYDIFGPTGFAIMYFMVLMWQKKRASEFQYIANPSILVTKHVSAVRGGGGEFENYIFLTLMFLGEMAGAALAYYWVTEVAWKFSSHWTFWKGSNYHMSRSPNTQLKATPNVGMMVEGFFTFASYAWPKIVKNNFNFSGDAALLLVNAGKACFAGIGQQYTGGFYNPILASSLEYTTGGHSLTTKFQVYWLAPIAAAVVAMFVF